MRCICTHGEAPPSSWPPSQTWPTDRTGLPHWPGCTWMYPGQVPLGQLVQVATDPWPWNRSAEDLGSLPHAVRLSEWKPTWSQAKKTTTNQRLIQQQILLAITSSSILLTFLYNAMKAAPAYKHVPSKVEETTGHIWVIVFIALFVCSSIFTVTLQAAFAALMQVRGYIDAGAVLEKGLTRLLQASHFALVF